MTGVRFPNHEHYQFHITLAYEIIKPSLAQQRELSAALARAEHRLRGSTLRLPMLDLTFFADMTAFFTNAEGAGR